MNRRQFSAACFALGGTAFLEQSLLGQDLSRELRTEPGPMLPPWSPGELDIHHIDTGRGNATFLVLPDATTLLIDCGAINDSLSVSAPCRPDNSRLPGEWVARYIRRHAPAGHRERIDYLLVTHIHPDHVGDIPPGGVVPLSGCLPTGVSHVDKLLPIHTVIDRGFPNYGLWAPVQAPFAANYLAWLDERRRNGRAVESARVGATDQITLSEKYRFADFSVRMISANGKVWTGSESDSRACFPEPKAIPAEDWPPENCYSISIQLKYGSFSYYSGGDLNCDTHDGRLPWLDVESAVAKAVGRTEVAVANHHAYFDSCGPFFAKSLDAQAWIIPAWHLTHPGQAQIERLLDAWPGERIRDVYATEMLPANSLLNDRWAAQLRSRQGHVVVRVARGGASWRIFVLDSLQEDGVLVGNSEVFYCRG